MNIDKPPIILVVTMRGAALLRSASSDLRLELVDVDFHYYAVQGRLKLMDYRADFAKAVVTDSTGRQYVVHIRTDDIVGAFGERSD